jgi:hypothetical protein
MLEEATIASFHALPNTLVTNYFIILCYISLIQVINGVVKYSVNEQQIIKYAHTSSIQILSVIAHFSIFLKPFD